MSFSWKSLNIYFNLPKTCNKVKSSMVGSPLDISAINLASSSYFIFSLSFYVDSIRVVDWDCEEF